MSREKWESLALEKFAWCRAKELYSILDDVLTEVDIWDIDDILK